MRSRQFLFPNIQSIVTFKNEADPSLSSSELILGFASRNFLEQPNLYKCLQKSFPNSQIMLCSGSGQILGESVYDEGIIINAISFDHTTFHCHASNINDFEGNSTELGKAIAHKFDVEGLKHILVFSDGQLINGSQLIEGFNEVLPDSVDISGGLAGDGALFQKTLVALNEPPKTGTLAAIGFYGDKIQISSSFKGGWDIFGPNRKITKSKDNVLYELDGKSALSLYKKYLGPLAEGLPGNALFFPLAICIQQSVDPVVRTILSINEEDRSMTFAGDMPEGSYARLMKSNLDRLIGASGDAAQIIKKEMKDPDFVLLISCVGRRIVMGHRAEEELDAVIDTFNHHQAIITGFYSYGELSPHASGNYSELHNQTIAITAFKEL